MSFNKLPTTAGAYSLLLDPDVSVKAGIPWGGHLPQRWRDLRQREDLDDLIQEQDKHYSAPTRLLADYNETSLQDTIDIPDHMEPYMKEFLERLVRDVYVKTNLRFQLPKPLFQNDDHLRIKLSIPTHRSDLSQIAYENNTRLTLIDDSRAFSSLKKTGKYRRGNFDITFSWYPGRDKINLWHMKAWADSLYQWTVELPSVVAGWNDPSFARGVYQLASGVAISCNRLTGIVPTWIPKYTDEDIEEECAREYFSWLQSEGFSLAATEVIVSSRRTALGRICGELPGHEYPAIFQHPKHGTLDFRLWIPDIRIRLTNILVDAMNSAKQIMGPKRMVMITSKNTEDASDVFLQAWHGCYMDLVKAKREEIDRLSTLPDLTSTVLDDLQVQYTVARFNKSRKAQLDEASKREMDNWKEQHPFKATSEAFSRRQRNIIADRAVDPGAFCDGVRDVLSADGLQHAARLLQTQEDFANSVVFSKKSALLRSARKAATIKIQVVKFPGNWSVEHAVVDGTTIHTPNIYRYITIRSSVPLWRMAVLGTRYFSWIWNSTFWLLSRASIGVRRWSICSDTFVVRRTILDGQGHFLTKSYRTIRGRIRAIWEWRDNIIEKASRGEHIIRIREGVYLDTCWAHFWTTAGLGIGTVTASGFTAVETLGTVAFVVIGLATAPIWSLLANLANCLYTTFILDRDLPANEDRRGPLIRNQFGITNLLVSTLRAVYHSLKGVTVAITGELRHLWNRAWHGIMTTLLKRAEVPTQAEGFFWSTSGPGMKTPFILIDSNTATLALLAYLSKQEISVARSELSIELRRPRRDLEERVRIDSVGTLHLGDFRILIEALTQSEIQNSGTVDRYPPLHQIEGEYARLLGGVEGNARVRMKREELSSFLAGGIPLLKKFYFERYFPRMSFNDVVQFWEQRDLPPGDWTGLANHVASTIFSREIVVPFEAAADDLVVEANQISGVEKIVEEALKEQGVVTGMSTESHVGHPIQLNLLPRRPNYDKMRVQFLPQPTKNE